MRDPLDDLYPTHWLELEFELEKMRRVSPRQRALQAVVAASCCIVLTYTLVQEPGMMLITSYATILGIILNG